MIQYNVLDCLSKKVKFTSEIDCEPNTCFRTKRRLAFLWALKKDIDLVGADFSGADLSDVDFSGANLSGVNLSYTILCGANIQKAKLSGANLYQAKFSWGSYAKV